VEPHGASSPLAAVVACGCLHSGIPAGWQWSRAWEGVGSGVDAGTAPRPWSQVRERRTESRCARSGGMGRRQMHDVPGTTSTETPPAAMRVSGGICASAAAANRAHLLMADVHPVDPVCPADRVDHRMQTVADHPEDAHDAGQAKHLDQLLGQRLVAHPDLFACGRWYERGRADWHWVASPPAAVSACYLQELRYCCQPVGEMAAGRDDIAATDDDRVGGNGRDADNEEAPE